jgi:tripartite-type tricarboxylate transporter receptor subunit TctC
MRVYAALPNLASAHAQGLTDFEARTWFAVFRPRGASAPIIRKLNQAAFATGDTPSAQEPKVLDKMGRDKAEQQSAEGEASHYPCRLPQRGQVTSSR